AVGPAFTRVRSMVPRGAARRPRPRGEDDGSAAREHPATPPLVTKVRSPGGAPQREPLRVGPGLASAGKGLRGAASAKAGRAAAFSLREAFRRRGQLGAVLAEICSIIESAVARRGAAVMGVVNATPDASFAG